MSRDLALSNQKLLFTLRSLVGGGVESTALTLHRHLSNSHWNVCLALMEDYGDFQADARQLRAVLRPRGGTRTPSQKEDLWFALKSAPRLALYGCRIQKLLDRMRPRVLFTHSGVEFLASARPVRKADTLWIAGVGSDVLRDITTKHPPLYPVLQRALRWLYSGPQRLVTVSSGLRRALVERLGLDPDHHRGHSPIRST